MKYLILLLLLGQSMGLIAQKRTGINTRTPSTTLHIKPSGTDEPIKIEGVKLAATSGLFMLVDDNGVVKTAGGKSNLAFILPSVSNTTGLSFSLASQTGGASYEENSAPDGSIEGGFSWTKIPQMESVFNILKPANSLSINVSGLVQYDGLFPDKAAVSYAIGIFLDQKLIATRTFYMVLPGSNFGAEKWNLLGFAQNLPVGNHTIEVYATRRARTGTANDDIYIAQPAPGATNINQTMAKAILQISGVYN